MGDRGISGVCPKHDETRASLMSRRLNNSNNRIYEWAWFRNSAKKPPHTTDFRGFYRSLQEHADNLTSAGI